MTRVTRISALALAVALLAAACGDGSSEPVFTTTTSSTTTTTTADTSTTTTTTTAATTTTAPTTTTSTTTSTTTTTTTPPPPEIVFQDDGLGVADFGDDPESVLAVVTAVFGASSFDTGWIAGGFGDYGVCPGTEFRRVEFDGGDFVVHFADGDHFGPAGTRAFYWYAWYGGAPGPTNGPPDSIDSGTTVATLLSMWPGTMVFGDDPFFGDTFRYDGTGSNQLWGTLTGTTDADQIIHVTGGLGCGE